MDFLEKIISYLEKDWELLSQAYATVLILMFVSAYIAFMAAKWGYGRNLDFLQSENKSLKGDVDKANLPKEPVTTQSAPLKMRTLRFVEALNEFLSNEKYKLDGILSAVEEDPENEHQQILHHGSSWMSSYNKNFKIEAISLKAELTKAFPKFEDASSLDERVYNRPVNFFDLDEIVNELHKLALKLDESQ